jgi:hypothetical protein
MPEPGKSMTVIVINLEHGPEGQPVGRLHKESGQTVLFTGWLDLVRVLEDEFRAAEEPTGTRTPDNHPSSAD